MIEVKHLEVVVMDNGEVICNGKTVGWSDTLGKYLHDVKKPTIIEKQIAELVKTIKEYESDTFSASGSEITDEEATRIAYGLVSKGIQDFIDLETLDGVIISSLLSDERGEDDSAMQLKDVNAVADEEEARSIAVDWQEWASSQNLSYGELAEYQSYFGTLGEKFGLTEEFKENGII